MNLSPPKAMISIIFFACLIMLLLYLPTMLASNSPAADYIRCSPLQNNCISKQSPLGYLKLHITPDDLPYDKPISVVVSSDNPSIQQLTLQFKGRDMEMGLLPLTLSTSQPGTYSGTTGLSYCTLGDKMVWLAELTVVTPQSNYRLIFELNNEV
ncbi:hypothetical protein H0A36_09485 [Endozoicomonas sp. SM1973]|uniref:YtkA-like domain-containing protein n=1 Tax=Spartinivicinus marinus TaxID=2994442 RepID=A0A853HYG7_9GAMM|nr:hypothetical protein [Spartinivicinus marinus]MCX4028081.1 hypothetical protein [Spartinivicinus marinus]NYZ66243.1 hypothetical protein [Spartinivicinus marinus]